MNSLNSINIPEIITMGIRSVLGLAWWYVFNHVLHLTSAITFKEYLNYAHFFLLPNVTILFLILTLEYFIV